MGTGAGADLPDSRGKGVRIGKALNCQERLMRAGLAAVLMLALIPIVSVSIASDAAAQACRQKCNDEEVACLKRTNNKSQCGERAKACAAKCK